MIKKVLVGMGIVGMGMLPCLSFAQSVQEFTQEICGFKIGDTVNETIRLVQPTGSEQGNYLLKEPELDGTPLYRKATVVVFHNQIASVALNFSDKQPEIGERIKESIFRRLGKPNDTYETNDSEGNTYISYAWRDDAEINGNLVLFIKNGIIAGGYIDMFNTALTKKMAREGLIKQIQYIRGNAEAKEFFENSVKYNKAEKDYLKEEMKEDSSIEQELRNSGVDMTIFD